jgi:hypothetical protein
MQLRRPGVPCIYHEKNIGQTTHFGDNNKMLDHPLPAIDDWVVLFSNNSLPVLRVTKRRLDDMRKNMDQVDGRELAHVILLDPVMTVSVLALTQAKRGRSLQHDITTIASAVMMIGVEPFFNHFNDLPTIEGILKGVDQHAMLGVLQIIRAPSALPITPRNGRSGARTSIWKKCGLPRCSTTLPKSWCGALPPNWDWRSRPGSWPNRPCAASMPKPTPWAWPIRIFSWHSAGLAPSGVAPNPDQ